MHQYLLRRTKLRIQSKSIKSVDFLKEKSTLFLFLSLHSKMLAKDVSSYTSIFSPTPTSSTSSFSIILAFALSETQWHG